MSNSLWRIGTALLCATTVCACKKTEAPSENPAVNAQAPAAPAAADTRLSLSEQKGRFPVQDLVLIKDYSAASPRYLFRVHMDVQLNSISTDLENNVRDNNGPGILQSIKDDLGRGTPAGWATLKAALGCADYTPENATCPQTTRVRSPLNPYIILVKDYSKVASTPPSWPANLLRIHMDLGLNGGNSTYKEIESALKQEDELAVLKALVNDRAIQAASPALVWATLKAALGCTTVPYDQDPAHC